MHSITNFFAQHIVSIEKPTRDDLQTPPRTTTLPHNHNVRADSVPDSNPFISWCFCRDHHSADTKRLGILSAALR